VILGGDLNFTTSSREMWGAHSRVDPLHPFFRQLLLGEGLVDVEPLKLIPTWRNGRGGLDYIAKRLDRFLISEELLMSGIRYRSWVCNTKISDHMPVILHVENDIRKVSYPFKFNSVWLEDPYFVELVRTNWNGLLGNEILSPMDSLAKKLKKLKSLVVIGKERRNRILRKSW
jgi:hypothetical protein